MEDFIIKNFRKFLELRGSANLFLQVSGIDFSSLAIKNLPCERMKLFSLE